MLFFFLPAKAHAPAGEFCRTADGYRIQTGVVYLAADKFNADSLTRFFSAYLDSGPGDVYMTATADPKKQAPFRLPNPKPREGQSRTDEPSYAVAYFFLIRGNAFFVFQDRSGHSQWIVIQGRNLFKTSPLGNALRFGSHLFKTRDDPDCDACSHKIVFVDPDLRTRTRDEILSTLQYLQDHFTVPKDLTVELFDDYDWALDEEWMPFVPIDEITIDGVYDREDAWQAFHWRTQAGAVYRGILGDGKSQFYEAIPVPGSKP